ncbi:hypothetical protein SAMN04515666_103618 [Bosea lupini]|uniref:Uncharacterized protein n=1 Tax=Bosea lupini TaxID=1036779 RepID=A0A1H7PVF7_9HYPH|nr:hypothetical protein SAMN04515666_103618 [Bosea lupini]
MPEYAARYGYAPPSHSQTFEQMAKPEWQPAPPDEGPPIPGEITLPALVGTFDDLATARKHLVDASKSIGGRLSDLYIFERRGGEWILVEPA